MLSVKNRHVIVVGILLLFILGGCSKKEWTNNGELGQYDKNVSFGSAIDGDGERCIIGLYGNKGAAVIYENDETFGWGEKAYLWAPDGEAGDRFGMSVGIDKHVAIVGADNHDWSKGAAYIFEESEGEWTRYYKLSAPDDNSRTYFGRSVDIEENIAVIGAPFSKSEKGEVGAVYVYEYKDEDWVMSEKLFSSEQNITAQFGGVLDLDGDWMVIGETRVFEGKNCGKAYIFRKEGTRWKEFQSISLKPVNLNVNFNISVSLCGNELLIGNTQSNRDGYAECEAKIYVFNENKWELLQELSTEGDLDKESFGNAVSLSSQYAFVSAPGAVIDNIRGSGAVYVFKKEKKEWVFFQKLVSGDPAELDFLGESVYNTNKEAFIGMPYKVHPDNNYIHTGGVLHFTLK